MATIDPADSRLFWRVTGIGVAVIWLIGLLVVAEKAGTVPPSNWFSSGGATQAWRHSGGPGSLSCVSPRRRGPDGGGRASQNGSPARWIATR